eukprot:1275938-Rhodomonas_salina.2
MGDDGGVLRWPHMVASLYPSAGVATHPACQEVPSAFGGFGIGKTTFAEEYGVSSKEGKFAGCRACRLHLSPHCAMPHLECAAHALPPDISPQLHSSSFLGLTGYTQGTPEVCALIKVNCVRLSSLEGKETYPVGEGDDWVISKESLQTEITKLRPVSSTENGLSVLIDVSNISECADIAPDGDWRNWPYLTTEVPSPLFGAVTCLMLTTQACRRRRSSISCPRTPPSRLPLHHPTAASSTSACSFPASSAPILRVASSLRMSSTTSSADLVVLWRAGGMWNHCRWFGLPPDRSAEGASPVPYLSSLLA